MQIMPLSECTQVEAPHGLRELYRPIADDLALVEQAFDRELHGDLPFVGELCDTVRAYRGKLLRPALLLLAARATGRLVPEHHTLGAVVELVHVATLVHDDVLDEADERRRQPTICSIHGNTAAVLLGDYLISHAFHLCSSLDDQFAARRIGATANTVCEGELLQNQQRANGRLSEDVYFDIIRRKTGALTAVACELGARFAGAGPRTITALAGFGLAIGTAFQIVDDVLDVTGDEERLGKTVGRDLATGKMTLPTIHALRTAPAGSEVFRCLGRALNGNGLNGHDVAALLNRTGSIDYALSIARRLITDSQDRLVDVPPSEAKASLLGLADFLLLRRS